MKDKSLASLFIVLASVVIVLAGVKIASSIVVPFLLSLFIAVILSPSYNYFNNKGIPSPLSLLIVISMLVIVFVSVAKLLGSSAIEFSSNLNFYEKQLLVHFHTLVEYLESFGIDIPEKDLSNILNPKQIMGFASGIINSMSMLLSNGFVILLTVIFMLLESDNFIDKITFTKKTSSSVTHIKQIFSQIKEYMVIKALISILTGFIIWIGLSMIGTDYPFLWAVLAFLLNFIPNIGSIIAAVPAVLLTLVQLDFLSASFVILLYAVVNILIGSVIEPKVMGKGLGLSTLVVFLSLIFWGWLLGIAGMLLSIPLTIMAKIVFNSDEDTKWISVLLGSGDNISKKTI